MGSLADSNQIIIPNDFLGNHPTPPKRKTSVKRVLGPREPKKLQVKKRVMGKWKTHPVDKMVKIANFIEPSNPELAAKIWMRLLDSCELEEKAKKSFLPPITGNESAAEAEALRLLEEAEKNEPATPQGDSNGMADGAADLQAQTRSTQDLSIDTEF